MMLRRQGTFGRDHMHEAAIYRQEKVQLHQDAFERNHPHGGAASKSVSMFQGSLLGQRTNETDLEALHSDVYDFLLSSRSQS